MFGLASQDFIEPAVVKKISDLFHDQMQLTNLGRFDYQPEPRIREKTISVTQEFKDQGIEVQIYQDFSQSQTLAHGWSAGQVLRVKAHELNKFISDNKVTPQSILVMDELPSFIPSVAGIIIGKPSSPYSHPALLMESFGSVLFYEKGAYESARWKDLEDSKENVFLRTKQGFISSLEVLQGISDKTLDTLDRVKRPDPLGKIPVEHEAINQASPLYFKGYENVAELGGKAAWYSYLRQLSQPNSIPAFSISTGNYMDYLDHAKYNEKNLRDYIMEKLDRISGHNLAYDKIRIELDQVRKAIQNAKIPERYFNPLFHDLRRKFGSSEEVFLRSSSNVEDGPAFSGPGLYGSVVASLRDVSTFGRQLKEFWSFLYTDRAFIARQKYEVDEMTVSMGALASEYFEQSKILARGVSIASLDQSENPNGFVIPKITITGFPQGIGLKVTSPPVGKTPETVSISRTNLDEFGIRVISRCSELPMEKNLLFQWEYQLLWEEGVKIHRAWPYKRHNLVLDFEWMVIKDNKSPTGRRMIINQVREIPSATPIKGTKDWGEALFIGGNNQNLDLSVGESSDAFMKMAGAGREVSISINSLELTRKNVLNQLDGIFTYQNSNGSLSRIQLSSAKKSFQLSNWKNTEAEKEERRFEVILELPVMDAPSLKLNMFFLQKRKLRTKSLEKPILTLADFEMNLTADIHDFPKGGNPSIMWDGKPQATYTWILAKKKNRFWRTPYIVTENFHFQLKDGTIIDVDVEAKTDFGGFDKTPFLYIQKVTILGFGIDPVVLGHEDSFGAVHAPSHHAFSYQYLFDLRRFSGSEGLIRKLGGPFLMFKFPNDSNESIDENEKNFSNVGAYSITNDGVSTRIGGVIQTRTNKAGREISMGWPGEENPP